MAFLTVSGEPGCRHEELARVMAQRLGWQLITDLGLSDTISAEFGAAEGIAEQAWRHVATSILAKLGLEHHLVVASAGSEALFRNIAGVLRVHVIGPESQRIGIVMVDCHMDRTQAKERLRQMEIDAALLRKARFGTAGSRLQAFDLVLNGEAMTTEQMAEVVDSAVRARALTDIGLLAPDVEAQVQFQVRLKLARFGIVPPDRVQVRRKEFGHPSEEVFANLLDFYRISWDYEPRSFPLQWDKDGKVQEAFTPDFYLPEFDLYVELTTMKQAHVTKKNRKIRLLRAIYPHVNIQVFYQKDVQDLVIKYGLPERLAQ